MSFLSLLQLLLIGLKLTGYITWSWWTVMSPTIVSVSVWAVLMVVLLTASSGED